MKRAALLIGLCFCLCLYLTAGNAPARDWQALRDRMVERQIKAGGVKDPLVLAAMQRVPRHLFVPLAYRDQAYEGHPLPIGQGQTISQPLIVAYMTSLLKLEPGQKVLEIGTGSGYQAAVLAEMNALVYSIEIVPELARRAAKVLRELGYGDIRQKVGDGYRGWAEHAPFDAVIVTAAPPEMPRELVRQLKRGGRMVVPVGPEDGAQRLVLVQKKADGSIKKRTMELVRFVPMVKGRE